MLIFLFFVLSILFVQKCYADQISTVDLNGVTYTYDDKGILDEKIKENQENKKAAATMADAARQLGYQNDHDIIVIARKEWREADINEKIFKDKHDELMDKHKKLWSKKTHNYPEATLVWTSLKKQGYSDYVAAGILGNIMAEVGGQTLDIQPHLSNGQYYGMCQWNQGYNIHGANLSTQINFLLKTIEYEFDTYGFLYQKNFNFNQFLKLKDEKQAALAFAKCYERCGRGSYYIRQSNASKAYNYFTHQ